MFTIEEIRKKKEEYGFTNDVLAKLSGVPLGTVQKALGNVTKSPRIKTVAKLSAVFENNASYQFIESVSQVGEPQVAYAVNPNFLANNTNIYDKQGSYTITDYLSLPDHQRAELIDGVIYDLAAPSATHQIIAGEIFFAIRDFIKKHKGTCIPVLSPIDVQLDCDNRTMVQPDIMIICDRSKINKRILGAPDFVAEVLSPATRGKDILIKSAKYQRAGVKEYWLIDTDEKKITVFDFRENISMQQYSFDEKVPVLLYKGKLKIDMPAITKYLSESAEID